MPLFCLVVVVQLLSCVWLFGTPWTAACLASLSSIVSQSLLKLISIELWWYITISSSVVPFSWPQSFMALGSFPVRWLFTSGGQSIGALASVSVLSITIQDWFPLGWTGLISCCPRNSQVFSSTTVWKHQFFNACNGPTLTSVYDYWKNYRDFVGTFVGKVMSLLFNMLSRLVITFLARSKRLLISWLQSQPAGILETKKIKPATVSIFSPSVCHEMMGPDAMILVF